jgi:hypothetical protein
MIKQKSLKKAIAFALMRWHGKMNPEIIRKAGDLGDYVFMSYPQVTKAFEDMDNTIDWTIVRRSLLLLTQEQLDELLHKKDLTVEDIITIAAAVAIEGLFE